MKKIIKQLNTQRVIALIVVAFAFYLLKSFRSDLKAGPIVTESIPSYDFALDDVQTREEKYAANYGDKFDQVETSDPSEDVLPNEKYGKDYALDQMLLESVISIIQGYYVDHKRVTNRDIYHLSLLVLKDILPEHKVKGKYIHFKDGKRNLKIRDLTEKKLSYSELMRQVSNHHRIAQRVLSLRGVKEPYAVLKGILQKLDAHSAMLSVEDYNDLKQGTEGVFGGLGVLVGMRDDVLTVVRPIPRSPAFRIGIKRDDKILSIDGHKTYGSSLDELVEYMRGAPGTKVKLDLLRPNGASVEKVAITREVIQVDSVVSKTFTYGKRDYLYVAIDSFSSRTTEEVKDALENFKKSHGGKLPGVILDLRSNPGGLLDQAVTVADLFLNQGVIVSTKGRRTEVENASMGYKETSFPMTVLINSESASASEIVAGALQDHGRALVVGQQSFGKGSVQTVFELPGQRAIKITIARYYTPKGRTIQNEGITPDVVFQPVYEHNENMNLLGEYRYRGEGSLSHALETKSFLDKNNARALYQSYYLTNGASDPVFTSDGDKEFDLAQRFLKAVNDHYGDSLPLGARRVGQQLYVANKEITKYLKANQDNVESFLAKKFDVSWGGDSFSHESLSVQLLAGDKIPVIPGKKAVVPVRIFNESNKEVNNVSLNLQTDQMGMVSKEVLVGKIGANSEVETNININVPTFWGESVVKSKVSLVVNGNIIDRRVEFFFDVKPRSTAKLNAYLSMVGEQGGSIIGALEANERAKLVLELSNTSDYPANATNIKLLNLAGHQIKILKSSKSQVVVPPKGKAKVVFEVAGAERMYDNKLSLGVYVDSTDLLEPYRKEVNIKGFPGAWSQNKREVLSH